jgi:aldose sugar dehydrogenase
MLSLVTKHLILSHLLFCTLCVLLCTLTFFPTLIGYSNIVYFAHASDTPLSGKSEPSQPNINDPNLKLELVSEGLQLPTQMAFLGPNDILVLEKDTGMVKRIVNGVILEEPLLDVNVATAFERGLVGIAIAANDIDNDNDTMQRNSNIVYLYYTESTQDANDDCSDTSSCSDENAPLGNRLYRYELVDNKLINPKLLLDLPSSSGAVHNGGSIRIGPDNNIYLPIGEVGYQAGQISNNDDDGPPPDGRGGILRVTQQGEAVETQVNGVDEDGDENNENDDNENEEGNIINGILGDGDPLNKYYAYGIRNSFGIDFDPITGNLWDTENGPGFGDEINLVEPGFNSGWSQVQGIWEYQLETEEKLREIGENYYGGPVAPEEPEDLIDFDGKGEYSTPEFIWNQTAGVTSIKFLDSDKLGKEYQNDMFVGDINRGNLYHFDLSEDRNQLLLDELQEVILGRGFNGITDIEVGPDGYLYVLSYAGSIFRISSNG